MRHPMRIVLPVVAVVAAVLAVMWVLRPSKEKRPDGGAGRGRTPAARRSAPPPEPSQEIPADWLAQAERAVQDEEAKPSVQACDAQGKPFAAGPRVHFVNRVHGLRAYFDRDGVEVLPREAEPSWTFRLRCAELRRDGTRVEDAPSDAAADGEDIVFVRSWGKEWYENRPAGIEQLFEVRERLAGAGRLEVHIHAEGLEVLKASEQSVAFGLDDQALLEYRDLSVLDAGGRLLPSRIESSEQGLVLSIDDAEARYPITVDPVVAAAAWNPLGDQGVREGGQADAFFGTSVATAGDVNKDGFNDVIVGARGFDGGQINEGRAFLFFGQKAGLPALPGDFVECDVAQASFGACVATAGDVNLDGFSDVVVGAQYFASPEAGEGAAFVYHGSASGLPSTANWKAEGNIAGIHFGRSVSTAGDVNGDGVSDLVIGASSFSNGQANEGAMFVYHGAATTGLGSQPKTVEIDSVNALFGQAVAAAGDVNGDGFADIVVGAPGFANGQSREGKVFVFHGSASGIGSLPAWGFESNQAFASLGASVATAGSVNGDGYADIIVGAPGFDNGEADEGQAVVYMGSAQGIGSGSMTILEENQAGAKFGSAVSTAGDVDGDGYADVVVGAPAFSNGEAGEGKVFLYRGSLNGLTVSADGSMESNQVGASLGSAVALAGDVNGDGFGDVVAGAPQFSNGQSSEGAAYVFFGRGRGPAVNFAWRVQGAELDSDKVVRGFGFSVAWAGDVNGDGFADVLVGVPGDANMKNGPSASGIPYKERVHLFYGSANGLPTTPGWTSANFTGIGFGFSVSAAGDVNGDGFGDIIVGAPETVAFYGRAYVYYGTATTGVLTGPTELLGDTTGGGHFGRSVACAGDVNGDGFSDVIVGAPGGSIQNISVSSSMAQDYLNGHAYVYYGSVNGISPALRSDLWGITMAEQLNLAGASTATKGGRFGFSVSGAGDVNRDGWSDVVIGAPHACSNPALIYQGAAYVFLGSSNGVVGNPCGWYFGEQGCAYLGWSVSAAGDVNGDGCSDVLIGTNYTNENIPLATPGKAYLVSGSLGSILSLAPSWTVSGQSKCFGYAVHGAGDVNGDGYCDVLVGEVLDTTPTSPARVFAYLGSSSGLTAQAQWVMQGSEMNPDYYTEGFGGAIGTAGDVNGDGFDDLVIGDPLRINQTGMTPPKKGQAFVYYGNDGAGVTVRPRQSRVNGTQPVQILGSTGSAGVKVEMLMRSPAGRTRVRWSLQMRTLATDLNQSPASVLPTSISLPLGELNSSITFSTLVANTQYHWRIRLQSFPFLSYGKWYSVGANGLNEADFRTGQ